VYSNNTIHIPSTLVTKSSDRSGTARTASLLRLNNVCATQRSTLSLLQVTATSVSTTVHQKILYVTKNAAT